MTKDLSIPDGFQSVRAVPDTETVEWNWSRAVHAAWITDDLKEETEQ